MRTPRVFIAYAPRGAGLRCAVVYLPAGHEVHGWFTGPSDGGSASAYFVLENFYTPLETRYVEIPPADLHARWTGDEAMCHELAELQDAFSREWLCYRSDPEAKADFEAYAEAELAAGEVAIRFKRLNKLSKLQPNWTFYSPDFERGVVKCLAKHWPLEYRSDDLTMEV
jgi:hypothetical protein